MEHDTKRFHFETGLMLRKDAGRLGLPLYVRWGPADYGRWYSIHVLVLVFRFTVTWLRKDYP